MRGGVVDEEASALLLADTGDERFGFLLRAERHGLGLVPLVANAHAPALVELFGARLQVLCAQLRHVRLRRFDTVVGEGLSELGSILDRDAQATTVGDVGHAGFSS